MVVLKKLIRLTVLLTAAAAVVWLTRERLLPAPRIADEPTPRLRSVPPAHAEPDDLTEIKGIGAVFAGRLHEAGIDSFRGLSEANVAVVAASVGTTESAVAGWIAQATAKLN